MSARHQVEVSVAAVALGYVLGVATVAAVAKRVLREAFEP